MSSSSGSGIGGRPRAATSAGNISLGDGAVVRAGDRTYDLSTAEGVSRARAELPAADLQAAEGLLRGRGLRQTNGTWVPSDSVVSRAEQGRIDERRAATGLTGTVQNATQLDHEVGEIFVRNGLANPYNAATTPALEAQLRGVAEFSTAVRAGAAFAANPTSANQGEFIKQMKALTAAFPHGNVMEVLFLVFRESIKETNDDKKYFLKKLQDYNTMAEELSEYLSHLVDESQRLSAASAGAKYPEKVTISIEVRKFDLTTLDPDGRVRPAAGFPQNRTVDRAGMNDTIKDVESMQETVRNKRQMASTSFQNFDQKANQLYNLMASVLKVMNEMRSSTVRNML
jgi:hypothetical protein